MKYPYRVFPGIIKPQLFFFSKKKLKHFFTLLLFATINTNSFSQVPDWAWTRSLGDTTFDEAKSMTIDANGNIYTTGTFTGTVDFDPGVGVYNLTTDVYTNIFTCKLDSLGNFVWATNFGGIVSGGHGYSICLDDSGNVYTTGTFSGTVDFDPGTGIYNLTSNGWNDMFICKQDDAGRFIWAKAIGGPNYSDAGFDIDIDPLGNVYVTGYFEDTVDFDPGPGIHSIASAGYSDIFLLKLESNGNFVWVKTIGGREFDTGVTLTMDAIGNIFIAGYFKDTIDFDPGPGVLTLISTGIPNVFIAKFDASGNLNWAKAITGLDGSSVLSICLDQFANVYTTGFFFNSVDFDPGPAVVYLHSQGRHDAFISVLDSSGNYLWAKSMGGLRGGMSGSSITLDPSGNIYLTGEFYGTVDIDPDSGVFDLIATGVGYYDIYVSKMDPGGNFIWAKATGGSKHDGGNSIALDLQNNIYTCGYFNSPALMVDSTILLNAGANRDSPDMFIGKIRQSLTGIEDIVHTKHLYIHPNPAKDRLFVSLKDVNSYSGLSVFDLRGRMIYQEIIIPSSGIELSTNTFSNGIYFLKILNDRFTETKMFMVEN